MVKFGTAGIRGSVVDRVTPSVALEVGMALASIADDVVLGHDGRVTSPALADAAAAGLTSAGANVMDVGMVPTAAVASASRGRHGLMITASHNPPEDNGLKLFDDGIEFDRNAEMIIEESVDESPAPASWSSWGRRRTTAVLNRYRDDVVRYLKDHGAQAIGTTVAVDCGHGMGGLVTPDVITELGADVRVVNGAPDGHFPGRPSKPTPTTLASFGRFVADSDADMALAHDGDADRLVVLDGNGSIVHEDTILAIIAHHYVEGTDVADPVVVTTPNASARVDEYVQESGGRVVRTALGALHEGIAGVSTDTDTLVVFAGEPWKHIHPAFGGWIDGIVSAGLVVRLVAEAGDLDTLRSPVIERPYRKESLPCPDDVKVIAMERIHDELAEQFPEASLDDEYGVRVSWPDSSWVLVRPSGTEPKIRIYLEADDVDERMRLIADIVSGSIDAVHGT